MNDIIIISAIPLFISFLLILLLAQRMKIISYNGYSILRRKGEESMGMEIGGLSIFPVILISMCTTLALPRMFGMESLNEQIEPTTMRVLQVIVGCALLYLMGVKDDFHGTGTQTKLLFVLLATAMFPASGLWINNLHGLFGIYEIPAWIGMPITLLVAVLLTQLLAVIDSPDGLTAGTTVFVMALFLALSIYGNHALSTIVASAAVGVALPYTVCKALSKKWEKTLMGSAGNYILGYILSYLTIGLTRQCGDRLPEEAIMVCVGITIVPVLDSLRVLRKRVFENREFLKPDKNQMQHLLIRTGLSPKLVSYVAILIITAFVVLNLFCLYANVRMSVIFIADLVVWTLLRVLIHKLITNHESIYTHERWNMEYGREAWEANVPTEILSKKRERFGTMGLPKDMVSSNTEEFIPDGMSGFERNTKRLFDFFAATVCLVLFSPLFLLCFIMIKLDDGGPAIFKQERIGRFGRPFYIYKFRSMKLNAEESGPALSHAGGEDDPRLTKVGKFLRAHHLDELPQLWNVFKGDMAFIGYRPERKFYIDQIMEYDPRYAFLYQIRPGVTSYATLHYGYTDTMEKMLRRLELDLYYLKNRSWWFDIKVLFLTFAGIVSGKKF